MRKIGEKKKIELPFLVQKSPFENYLAYEKKGHWTEKEKLKYDKFTSRGKKKRFYRIFKVMSDFIKTRTHNQCRSHHQKMEKERFEVQSIIKIVVQKYHPRVYQEFYDRYLIEIENLNLEDHEEYKMRNINQNSLKYDSEPKLDIIKNPLERQLRQKLGIKQQYKKEEYSHQFFKNGFEQEAPIIQEKPRLNKRELRITEECEEGEKESERIVREFQNDFPPRNQFFFEKQISLDFASDDNLMRFKFNPQKKIPMSLHEYLMNLERKKLECLNKAAYHYQQMQIELANVAQCENNKTAVLEQQKEIINHKHGFQHSFPNLMWGFS